MKQKKSNLIIIQKQYQIEITTNKNSFARFKKIKNATTILFIEKKLLSICIKIILFKKRQTNIYAKKLKSLKQI